LVKQVKLRWLAQASNKESVVTAASEEA
jgi:hypothetical protein